jgi:hypothetical protein
MKQLVEAEIKYLEYTIYIVLQILKEIYSLNLSFRSMEESCFRLCLGVTVESRSGMVITLELLIGCS